MKKLLENLLKNLGLGINGSMMNKYTFASSLLKYTGIEFAVAKDEILDGVRCVAYDGVCDDEVVTIKYWVDDTRIVKMEIVGE